MVIRIINNVTGDQTMLDEQLPDHMESVEHVQKKVRDDLQPQLGTATDLTTLLYWWMR
jgi:hypothetical protein